MTKGSDSQRLFRDCDSVNRLIIDALAAEIERVRSDDDFTARAKKLLEPDREILDRLAK